MTSAPDGGSTVSTPAARNPATCSRRGSTPPSRPAGRRGPPPPPRPAVRSRRQVATAPATVATAAIAYTTPSGTPPEREYGGHRVLPGTGGTAALGPRTATATIPATEISQHAAVITSG